jgi:rRNA maturation protein Rpf1
MDTYELFCRDLKKGYKRIGILPERRRNPARITQKSVMNWGKIYFYKNLEINSMFFFQVTIDKNTGRIFRTNPFFLIQK